MLAYRHAFHAGNHADVLKHIVLMLVLEHMNLKEKGWRCIDTHAGAGGYSLLSEYAAKRGEFEQGIASLWSRNDLPSDVAQYVALVRSFNGGDKPSTRLTQYPGSPTIAQAMMRPQDSLRLFEMHPTDHKILASYMEGAANVEVKLDDGFARLKAQLPPPTRRGVVLIDPSYELKTDYTRALAAVREALTQFPDCVVVVWLPQLQLLEATQLPQRLKNAAESLGKKGWLLARLTVAQAGERGFGLMGSSLFIANPPHTLQDRLKPLLPWLCEALAQFDGATHRLEHSIA